MGVLLRKKILGGIANKVSSGVRLFELYYGESEKKRIGLD